MCKLKLEITCRHLLVTLYWVSLLAAPLGCGGNGGFGRADASLAALAKEELESRTISPFRVGVFWGDSALQLCSVELSLSNRHWK